MSDFTDEECLCYYAARMVQNMGVNNPTPKGTHGATWGAWFVSRYGETLKQYAERARAGNFREKAERARKRIAENGPEGHKPKRKALQGMQQDIPADDDSSEGVQCSLLD